ncbi:MAG TPA: MBL fold metallo-hydrolase [Blastocatellia bacterium]|nr:MBL fold metallo-hydrolase [Blastocatellia bacterium]
MRRKGWRRSLLWLAALLFAGLLLLAYTFVPRRIDVAAYQAGATDFHPAGVNPADLPDVQLSLIKCGKMISRQSFVYRGGSWKQTYESGMAAALIRHPRATFLFDTGFGTNVDEDFQHIPFLMRELTVYDKEQPAIAQLAAGGVGAEQINMILLSHSHWDHVSGWEDFPAAEGWMMREEADYSRALPDSELMKRLLDRVHLRELDLNGPAYENFDRSLDLFGDASIVLVPLPGHTPGSMGMFVNLRSGKRFFFIGDLTWCREGVELPAERPWLSRRLVDKDPEQVRRSLVRVHELAKRYPDLIIVPTHDRRVHEQIAAFPNVER